MNQHGIIEPLKVAKAERLPHSMATEFAWEQKAGPRIRLVLLALAHLGGVGRTNEIAELTGFKSGYVHRALLEASLIGAVGRLVTTREWCLDLAIVEEAA